MGYFNFNFLKKFFKNKYIKNIIYYFTIICFFMFVFCNFVLAVPSTNFSYTLDGITVNITLPANDNRYTYIVFWASNPSTAMSNGYFNFYSSKTPFKFTKITVGGVLNYKVTNSGENFYYGHYYSDRYSTSSKRNTFEITNSSLNNNSNAVQAATYFMFSNNDIPIYESNGTTVSGNFQGVPPPEIFNDLPYFLNTPEDIAQGEQDLIIMPADFPNTKQINFKLLENNPTEIGAGSIQDNWTVLFNLALDSSSQFYEPIDSSGVGFYYKVPWTYLTNYLQISKEYNYQLSYTINNENIEDDLFVTYGGLTPEDAIKNALSSQNNILRDQTANQEIMINQQQEMINQQEQTTEAINDLNDTMTNPNIESGASDLPSTNVQDPTQNGIDNIFQSIYNAFCTGQAQDIVFPIPFTNKNITLSPYYVKDMLTNFGANWIYTLIQAFWGYFIGRFIVKDISHKINKIKSGDVENIENNNIKEEML